MSNNKTITALKLGLLQLLCLAIAPAVNAQSTASTFPDRGLTYVITVPPGGAADFVGRTVATALSEEIKQPVVVDNRAGASGSIAAAYVARAKPDGHTLLHGAISTHGIGPHFLQNLSYDPLKDFMSLGLIAEFPLILAVRADLPVQSVDELVALAKKSPGTLKFASAGVGSAPHLTAEILMADTEIKMLHIPYKGSAPAVRDVIAGEVDMMFDGLPSLSSGLSSGKLRAIAAVGTGRNAAFPNLPTFTELGYPKMVSSLWYIPMVPAGTPPAIVEKLNASLVKSLKGTEAEKRLQLGGANLVYTTPAETQAYIKNDHDRWGAVIKAAGVPTQQ